MNVVCLVIDRLHAGYVGAYGNTWIATPHFDRFASRSFLLENALIDSTDLDRLYRSYWQGWHGLCPTEPPESRPSLPSLLRQKGATTALLSDEPQLARHPAAADFDELLAIDPAWQPKPARRIDQTHFSRCFERMIDWLASVRTPFMLWCHLGGLGTTWDAPAEFRQAYVEPGDPPPPEGAEPPERLLPPDCDPDERLGISQCYAGQVSLLDACLGAFVDFFDSLPAAGETLLAITSARGFPLGEHQRVGACDDALFGELVHVPLMMLFPNGAGAAGRSHALVEPSDLWAGIIDWCEVDDPPVSPSGASLLRLVRRDESLFRNRLCMAGRDEDRAIRTPAWHLIRGKDGTQLYAKPDDRWEINDVASLCDDVTEGLTDALARYEQVIATGPGRVADLPPLGDLLIHGLE